MLHFGLPVSNIGTSLHWAGEKESERKRNKLRFSEKSHGTGEHIRTKETERIAAYGIGVTCFFPFVIASMDQRKRLHLQFASQQLVRDDLV
jgi:hypothetical protein